MFVAGGVVVEGEVVEGGKGEEDVGGGGVAEACECLSMLFEV